MYGTNNSGTGYWPLCTGLGPARMGGLPNSASAPGSTPNGASNSASALGSTPNSACSLRSHQYFGLVNQRFDPDNQDNQRFDLDLGPGPG